MAVPHRSLGICTAVLCTVVLLVMPAMAANAAIYGSTAGFAPALHSDTFTVTCSLPGTAGIELDNNISCFTNASADVLFIGGDSGFSGDSATKITGAVNAGRILVVSGQDLSRFTDIIPARTSGTVAGSPSLNVSVPNSSLSADLFAGLPSGYANMTAVSSREQYVAKNGTTTLMSFANGDPALVFGRYGSGYVVAWLPPADQAYLSGTEADTINERLLTHLLAMRGATTVPTPAVATAANATTATETPGPAAGTGNVSVYSSPLSANVYIDGVYEGITPVNLTGIATGSHALKLALTGYYDYDATIAIMGGGTITAFGSLAPHDSTTTVATPVPATTTDTSSSIWSSPAVVAAVLGIITAVIGAAVTIFTIYHKHK